MSPFSYNFAVLILAFVLHECGHYVGAWLYRLQPRFALHWWGASVPAFYVKLRFSQYCSCLAAGVLAGVPALLLLDGEHAYWYLMYLILSSVDLISFIGLISAMWSFGDRKMADLPFLIK